jgi:hypothetical protein
MLEKLLRNPSSSTHMRSLESVSSGLKASITLHSDRMVVLKEDGNFGRLDIQPIIDRGVMG